ncbi:MAG: tetratricopeptide repeat protein [Bryobacteraceae bacterium]
MALSDPAQVGSLLQQGLTALQQGRLQEARKNLEIASKLEPKNPYAWTSLAETYFRLKDRNRASTAAETAEKVGSEDPIVWHALAMYYSESGEFGKAGRLEARFAESPKSDPEATARAAGLYLNAGETDSALSLARKSAAQQISAAHENLLGRALAASGQLTEGTQHLGNARQLAPGDPKIAFDYAQVLLRKEDFEAAADVLDSATAAHPNDSQLVLGMGVARYGQRRFEDSIVLFLRVISLDPSIEQPYIFLGQMLDQAGSHLAEITGAYREWMQREPKNAKASFLLAKALLAGGGNDEEAEMLLRRSISTDDSRWESHYELGVLAVKKRDYQAALAELTRSVNLEPKQPTTHYQLARVYDRIGEPEKAKAERAVHAQLTTLNPAANPH